LKAGSKGQVDNGAATARTLRSVLAATGDNAKIEELYRLLNAEEAARFLGLAEPTVRDMTYRHELPYTRVGVRGVRYRLIDLILWSERRSHPAEEKFEK
jgi:excisionase family DNA binding protein